MPKKGKVFPFGPRQTKRKSNWRSGGQIKGYAGCLMLTLGVSGRERLIADRKFIRSSYPAMTMITMCESRYGIYVMLWPQAASISSAVHRWQMHLGLIAIQMHSLNGENAISYQLWLHFCLICQLVGIKSRLLLVKHCSYLENSICVAFIPHSNTQRAPDSMRGKGEVHSRRPANNLQCS